MNAGRRRSQGPVPGTSRRAGLRADIAFRAQLFQRHAVAHTVYRDEIARSRPITIDGNRAAGGTRDCNDSAGGSWIHFFKVAQLPCGGERGRSEASRAPAAGVDVAVAVAEG